MGGREKDVRVKPLREAERSPMCADVALRGFEAEKRGRLTDGLDGRK